jgi:predicted deacetylase
VKQRLCIALHDVAAATWPQCTALLAMLDELGRPPLTLLAVPNYHALGPLTATPDIVRSLQQRIARGDEVALHGYFHRDDAPAPRTPADWLRRRVLTASEGEFSALSRLEAARRLDAGRKELGSVLAPMHGFVAPAWLTGSGTWSALRDSPFLYAATRDALVVIEGMRRVAAPAITVSARSRWRRAASRIWLRALYKSTASVPLLRVALHPVDAEHADVIGDWRRALRLLLDWREPVTKATALGFN